MTEREISGHNPSSSPSQPETEPLKEFLAREEIRTMQKDIDKLRETESLRERERIAALKADGEAKKERERLAKLKKEEEERKRTEEGAKRGETEEVLQKFSEEKRVLDIEQKKLIQENNQLVEALRVISKKEKEIEEKARVIEGREIEAKIPLEKQKIEKERWQIEEERRQIESERWQQEEKKEQIVTQLKEIDLKYQEILDKEEKIKSTLRPERKEEELKEAEIKEMPPEEIITKPLPKKPSSLEKVFIRILILASLFLICLNLFLLWYWYFKIDSIPEISPPPAEELTPPEITIPPALISAEETRTLEISAPEELPNLLSQVFQEDLEKNQFTRILIKNTEENKILGLKDFFETFDVRIPENFYQKLENDFTLFIYSQKEGNRLGFLTKVREKEGLSDLLKSWGNSMEKDLENLFLLMEKEKPALVPYFRNAIHQGIIFRYQTFTYEDLGICYLIFDDYFILTSSWESIAKTIDKLIQ